MYEALLEFFSLRVPDTFKLGYGGGRDYGGGGYDDRRGGGDSGYGGRGGG